MKNNKGITLVEIIVSVVLIAIVVIFIFNLMVTVKNINDNSNESSTNIINKNIIISKIQKDFNDRILKGISNCTDDEKGTHMASGYKNYTHYCIKFTYATGTPGYLLYYTYDNSKTKETYNIIGYIYNSGNSDDKVLRQSLITPVKNDNVNVSVKKNCTNNGEGVQDVCSINVVMPVYESDTSSYDINLNYIYKVTDKYNVDVNYTSDVTTTLGYIYK